MSRVELAFAGAVFAAAVVAGCTSEIDARSGVAIGEASASLNHAGGLAGGSSQPGSSLDAHLAKVVRDNALTGDPAKSFAPHPAPLVELGRNLIFDKIMGGEENMACITCHFPSQGSGDAMRLSRGVGAHGVGPARAASTSPPGALVPRNAPPIWNSGLFKMQFWDGRIAMLDPSDPSKGCLTPDGVHTDVSTSNAAQSMFPETAAAEMRGGAFPGQSTFQVRDSLAARIGAIPSYVTLFANAYGDGAVTPGRVATAIGAYEDHLLVVDTPWFAYVRSVVASNGVSGIASGAISDAAKRGALLFYGSAGCASCHSGDMGTDSGFHNVGIPQFGPGKGDGVVVNGGSDDFGRARVTNADADRYKFRTPTMVNVALHAPYGHDGAYLSLRDFVAHYNDVGNALATYDNDSGTLEPALVLTLHDVAPVAATLDPLVASPLGLASTDIDDLMAFLQAQTDPSAATKFVAEIPTSVPSGLPVDPAF